MNISIIGCGNMGSGFAEILSTSHHIFLYDHNWGKTEELAKKMGGTACKNISEAIEQGQIIILAIKPQNLKAIPPTITPYLTSNHLIISLLAGTPLSSLQEIFPVATIVRIMPNLAIRYGAGVIGIVDSSYLSQGLKNDLEELLRPLGLTYWLKEEQIDALTSLAGSGPAFIFTLIESMIEAGVAMGLKAQDAQHLTLEMMQGCLTMMRKTGEHPAKLKIQIASPGGTTIAGLRKLEEKNVRSGVIETFLATYQRTQELGK